MKEVQTLLPYMYIDGMKQTIQTCFDCHHLNFVGHYAYRCGAYVTCSLTPPILDCLPVFKAIR